MTNHVKSRRMALGWSQAELAQRAGISRAAVSAIEMSRLVPSVAAALSLASVLNCSVESLFDLGRTARSGAVWAWPPSTLPMRYWVAEVRSRTLLFPAEECP